MAGVTVADPSIYNNLWKPDPMAGVDLQQKYQAIRQASQQNQLTQQELQFRQGLSEAESNSIGPDGTQDTGKFNKLIASDPRTAWKAQEILQQGNTLNAPTGYTGTDASGNPIQKAIPAQFFRGLPGQPGIQHNALTAATVPNASAAPTAPNTSQFSPEAVQQAHDKVGALEGAATELANNPNPNRKDAIGTFSDLISSGHLKPQEAIQVMSDPKDPLPDEPSQIQAWAVRHAQQLGQKKQLLETHAPISQAPSSNITANSPTPPVSPAFANGMKPVNDLNDILHNPESVPGYHEPGTHQQSSMTNPAAPTNQQSSQNGSPGITMGTPVGYEQKLAASRERINNVQNEASSVPQQNAIFDQISNLSKSGAPTGDIEAKTYKLLSEKGLVDPTSKPEQQREEITKYMEQAALAAGMPSSDARLAAVHGSNVNENQLPGAIQSLVSFLKASNQGKVLKQAYYNKVLGGSLNPDQEVEAKQKWDENYDPRIIEFQSLPDTAAKKAYLSDHPDFKSLIPKMKILQQLEVIK